MYFVHCYSKTKGEVMVTFNIDMIEGICPSCKKKIFLVEGKRCVDCIIIMLKQQREVK